MPLLPLIVAVAAATQPSAPARLVPMFDPQLWVTNADYPPMAIKEKLEGVLAFKLMIGADGRPVSCTIEESSGHEVLDDTFCRLVVRRARFAPFEEEGGPLKPWRARFRWSLPK